LAALILRSGSRLPNRRHRSVQLPSHPEGGRVTFPLVLRLMQRSALARGTALSVTPRPPSQMHLQHLPLPELSKNKQSRKADPSGSHASPSG
jgi:hypothetical protein